jgi:hypothetical protein
MYTERRMVHSPWAEFELGNKKMEWNMDSKPFEML